jgi:hypothetical protein
MKKKRKPLSGQAEFRIYRNDMFWDFHKIDCDNGFELVKVKWTGYNDEFWWNNVAPTEEAQVKVGSNGRKYKINFRTCEVVEVE